MKYARIGAMDVGVFTRGDRMARVSAGAVLFVPALAMSFGFPEHFRFPKMMAGEGLACLGAIAAVATTWWWGGRAVRWTDFAWDLTVLAAILSLLVNSTHPLTGWQDVGRVAALSLAYSLFRSVGDPWRFAPLVVLAAMLNAFLGLMQGAGFGLWETALAGRHAIYGTFGNPNLMAEYLGPALIVGMAGSGSKPFHGFPSLVIRLVVPLVLIAGIGLAGGRAPLVGALAGFVVCMLVSLRAPVTGDKGGRKPVRLYKLELVVAVLLLLTLLWTLASRRGLESAAAIAADPTVNTRTFMAEVALRQIRERVWLGQGPAGYGLAYLETAAKFQEGVGVRPGYAGVTREAHNDVLQMVAERGLVGCVVLVGALLLTIRRLPGGPADGGAAGAVVAIGIAGLFGFPLHVMPTGILLVWALSCLAALGPAAPGRRAGGDAVPKKAAPRSVVIGRTVLLGLGGLLVCSRSMVAEAALRRGSEAALRAGLKALPGHGELHFRLGLGLNGQGRLDEAEVQFVAALPGFPDPDVRFNLGWIALQRKDYSGAADRFREGLRLYPFFKAAAWADYAQALAELKKRDEALAAARRALAIDPNLARAQQLVFKLERN